MKSQWQDRLRYRCRSRRRRAPRARRLAGVVLRCEALEARIVLSSDPLLLADAEAAAADEAGPNSLTGFVYVDANQDGQRDAAELGVPGSLITISGVDGDGAAVERSVLTLADGSYLFEGLPDGTYDVIQQQPAAMHDGEVTVGDQGGDAGENRVSNIALTDAVAAAGYHFGELGLRADYISVSLHLASNPPIEEVARAVVARGEEVAGNMDLAAQIRAGGADFDPARATARRSTTPWRMKKLQCRRRRHADRRRRRGPARQRLRRRRRSADRSARDRRAHGQLTSAPTAPS